MPDDVRERVRRLIDLAVHPTANEGEARNAAWAAVKLIKEHKLLVVPPPSPQVRTHVSVASPSKAVDDMAQAFDELFGQHFSQQFRGQRARQQQRVRERAQQREQAHPTRPPPEHTVEGGRSGKIPKDPRARQFILGSPAVCAFCIEEIPIQTMVVVSGRAVYHGRCYEEATT